jgi:hypothetical protein
VRTPGQIAVRTGRIVLGRQDGHVMPAPLQRGAKRGRVNLGAGLVAGKEVVDRVEDAEPQGHLAGNRADFTG